MILLNVNLKQNGGWSFRLQTPQSKLKIFLGSIHIPILLILRDKKNMVNA